MTKQVFFDILFLKNTLGRVYSFLFHPDNPTGTVVEKTNYSITVVFDRRPPSFLYKKGLRLDLFVNDITFQRMLDDLEVLAGACGRLAELFECGFNPLQTQVDQHRKFKDYRFTSCLCPVTGDDKKEGFYYRL